MTIEDDGKTTGALWDHTTRREFFEYFASESESKATEQRFRGIQAAVLRVGAQTGMGAVLDVADIGCGAGTQCRIWAEHGHRVWGVDVNEPFILLAEERAKKRGLDIRFEVGTATALSWADRTMDVCLLTELLEHVVDWQSCIHEAARILRPGGVLFLSTTNVLCPKQHEFSLPIYSWYPVRLKRYCEHLAITSHPEIANHAKYPAVNWFSFYGLRDFLEPMGFQCLERFDLIDPAGRGTVGRGILRLLQWSALLRFLGHLATPGTSLVAVKSTHGSDGDRTPERKNRTYRQPLSTPRPGTQPVRVVSLVVV